MRIVSVGCALPPHRYPQAELTAALRAHLCAGDPGAATRLERFHRAARVEWRHLALPREAYAELSDFGAKNAAFVDAALRLGEEAVGRALAGAGVAPEEVDAIFVVSVTGIAVPTLDARLAPRLGLRADVVRHPLFGLGCVGGAAGLARLHDYLRAWPEQVAVLLAVELCSLTLQGDDLSAANLIGSGLFADGAAAVVGVGNAHPRARAELPRTLASRSRLLPESEDAMGWSVSARGFGLLLSPDVPRLVRAHLRPEVEGFLAAQRLTLDGVGTWICHPGGPKVLAAVQRALELPEAALEGSWRSLREMGNLSSASVLFVLADALGKRDAGGDGHALLLAMGPGFCTELVLLEW